MGLLASIDLQNFFMHLLVGAMLPNLTLERCRGAHSEDLEGRPVSERQWLLVTTEATWRLSQLGFLTVFVNAFECWHSFSPVSDAGEQ